MLPNQAIVNFQNDLQQVQQPALDWLEQIGNNKAGEVKQTEATNIY